MDESAQIKCGYCGWLMSNYCQNIYEHECFQGYDENEHLLSIDENAVAILVRKEEEDQDSFANSNEEFNERLIMAVLDRPSLYDFRINVKERSKIKKSSLWEEIRNILGGDRSIKDLQKRWKYLRDCYMRSKRKMKEYVPSGSAASASANLKSNFKFFELMKPLDDTFQTKLTVSTLSRQVEESSSK